MCCVLSDPIIEAVEPVVAIPRLLVASTCSAAIVHAAVVLDAYNLMLSQETQHVGAVPASLR